MLALLGVAAAVLVAGAPWGLPAAAGGTRLKPPQNVEVDIVDDTFTLRWDRRQEPAGDMAVSADYQIPGVVDNWTKLPGCQHVTSATCDFSSLNTHAYEEVKLRVRAEDGDRTSPWHELDPFIPFQQARIGPPEVLLEAEDKAVAVSILPPGAADRGMWHLDRGSFVYSVVVWSNATGPQTWNETLHSRYPRFKVHGLAPETTYCVTARARLLRHRNPAAFSPVRCVSTAAESELPAPENVKVVVENQAYVLRWDYTRDNVTFQAQWLNSYLKRVPGRNAEKWAQVQGCERAPAARCALPPALLRRKEVYFRVRASRGDGDGDRARASPWSQEHKFDAGRAAIPPPVVALKALDSHALQVAIGFQDQTDLQDLLTYEVRFWENTSNTERTIVEQRSSFPVPGLRPRTVYCAAAEALLEAGPWSQRSGPGNTACARTAAGGGPGAWLAAGLGVLLVLCAAAAVGKLAHYVFSPAGRPPSAIGECFPAEPLKSLLLPAPVERTEQCLVVVEHTDTGSADGTHGDEDRQTYASQTSQDSGNYSIEDGSAGSGEEPGPPGAGAGVRSAGGRSA